MLLPRVYEVAPVYKEHPAFSPPPPDAILWRYMDFAKFTSLIDKRALFFARADRLGDPFEGSTSQVNTSLHPIIYKDSLNSDALKGLPIGFQSLRRFHLINCWHWGEHESDAMWTRYSRQYDGIAVKTSFQALSNGFSGQTPVYIGKVNYIDYSSTFIPEGNAFAYYLHKRRAFEHEKEVRAIILKFPPMEPAKKELGILGLPDICEVGMYFEVDIATLIEEIVVAPFAPDWFIELVQSVTAQYGLPVSVRKSSLSDLPVWG